MLHSKMLEIMFKLLGMMIWLKEFFWYIWGEKTHLKLKRAVIKISGTTLQYLLQ